MSLIQIWVIYANMTKLTKMTQMTQWMNWVKFSLDDLSQIEAQWAHLMTTFSLSSTKLCFEIFSNLFK